MAVIALTVVILIIALIFFFAFGSDVALLFAMVGVPAIFIALVIALVLGGRTPSGEELKIKRRELDAIAHKFLEFRSKVSEMGKEFNVDTDRAELELRNVEEALNRQGCVFKGGMIKYDEAKVRKTKLAEIGKIGKEITEITHKVADAIHEALREKINWYVEEFEKLSVCGYEVEEAMSSLNSLSGSNVRSDLVALEKLGIKATEEVKGALEGCLSRMQESVAFSRGFFNVTEEEKGLELAEANLHDEDYGNSVFLLDKLMTGINEKLSGNFREYKIGLLKCCQDILSVMDEADTAGIKKLKEVVEGVNTPSQMKLLMDAFNDLVRKLNEVLERLHRECFELQVMVEDKRVPEWFSEGPGVPEVGDLPSDVKKLPEVFGGCYKELRTIVGDLRDKSRVLKAYSRVEGMISRRLEERGEVSGDELKVKRAELFMQLYSEKHPEVTYDETRQQLKVAEGFEPSKAVDSVPVIERFAVELKIRDAESGTPLEAGVIVGKREYNVSGGEFSLKLPHGLHNLKVLADGYASKDMQVDVEGDTEVEVELEKQIVPIVDLLCGDMKERIKTQIPRLDTHIERSLKERGYVTSKDEIGIKKTEYVPCFLYLWAEEREDAKFVNSSSSDDRCLVYDAIRAKEKLVDTVNGLKIDIVDSYSFDEIANLMALPLPAEELKALLEEVIKDDVGLNYHIEVDENIVRLVRRK